MNKDIFVWLALLAYFILVIMGIATKFFNVYEYTILLIIGIFVLYKGIIDRTN
jgi:uncharacterized membrane protein HdeD (DUF308 family)